MSGSQFFPSCGSRLLAARLRDDIGLGHGKPLHQSEVSLLHYQPAYRDVLRAGLGGELGSQFRMAVKVEHLPGEVGGVVWLKIRERVFAEIVPDRFQTGHQDSLARDDEFGKFIGKSKIEEDIATDGENSGVALTEPGWDLGGRHLPNHLDFGSQSARLGQAGERSLFCPGTYYSQLCPRHVVMDPGERFDGDVETV